MSHPRIALKDTTARASGTLFNPQRSQPEAVDLLMKQQLEKLGDKLALDASPEEKRKIMSEIEQTFKSQRSMIKELISDKRFMSTLAEQKEQLDALQNVSAPEELEPILTRLGKTLPRFDMPSSFTMAAFLLMVLPAVAAQLTATNGSPPGGADMCDGQNAPASFVSCLQGFISRAPSNASIMQFMQVIQPAGRAPGQSADYWAFRILADCLGWDKMANMTISSLSGPFQNSSLMQSACSAQSTVWNNMQATGNLLGTISDIACRDFQSVFTQTAQRCMNNQAYFWSPGTIAGIAIGGLAVAIIIVVVIVACCVCACEANKRNELAKNIP